jgi:hypothetical protein
MTQIINENLQVNGDVSLNGDNLVSLHYGNRGRLGQTPNFNPDNNNNGLWLEASGDSESGGIFCNGNTIVLWSPGDNDTLRVYDEDDFNAATLVPKFVINKYGNVGIGTSLPQSLLQIGDGLAGGYRSWMTRGTQVAWDSDNVFLGLKDQGANRKDAVLAWGDDADDAFRFIFAASGGSADGQEIMRLQPNGNVGIGTTAPQAKLEVKTPWSDWLFLRQERDVDGGGFHIHNPWGNSNQPQGDPSRNRLEIAYQTATGQDLWGQFVIHGPTGNVGIGTANPQAKLDVNGDIKVKDWTLSVPDYVFNQDYALRDLDELRDYIDTHKHLPEIPSAQKISEDGVNIGEFCMSLLKKVEELSLYILQQHEIIQEQNERIIKLERSIDR